ncbi:hypothetical protein [Rhizobium wenxiniae]|uniref:hypothetical protein n=1 Tax=Rhizobium wenxiniae TaxID=1737357 RepID=UPI001CB79301|nr:hypothetical protein [Rhizobium wenxiniae]
MSSRSNIAITTAAGIIVIIAVIATTAVTIADTTAIITGIAVPMPAPSLEV